MTAIEKAFRAYCAGRITRDEMYRYQHLYKKLMIGSFVIIENTPDWKEFEQIGGKL